MRLFGPRLRRFLWEVLLLAALPVVYGMGYRDGFKAQQPDRWAIVLVTARVNGIERGASYSWFDRNIPAERKSLQDEIARLESIDADFYVSKALVETSIRAEPHPSYAPHR